MYDAIGQNRSHDVRLSGYYFFYKAGPISVAIDLQVCKYRRNVFPGGGGGGGGGRTPI